MPAARTKLRFLLLAGLLAVAGLQFFRLAFLGHFDSLGGLAHGETWRALYLGLKFDLRLVALALMPAWLLLNPGGTVAPLGRTGLALGTLAGALGVFGVVVVLAMADDNAARGWLALFLVLTAVHRGAFPDLGLKSGPIRWIWSMFGVGVVAFLLLAYFADFGTFSYVHTRLNGKLLMFLENPGTSARMLWESYPVVWLSLALGAFLALVAGAFRRATQELGPSSASPWLRRGANLAFTVLLLLAMWGKASRYPLRWSEAFDAKHGFNAHLALNPILFFLETRIDRSGDYDLAKVKATHAAMADYFGIPVAFGPDGLPSLAREGQPFGRFEGEPNVVFIQLESLGANKTGLGGNPLNPTPFLDDLAKRSLCFDQMHVVLPNTSRSMFATLFGVPDVTSGQNATRNPLLVNQHSALAALGKREASFWLGGSANWAQIRGVLKNNFKGLDIHDEGAFPGLPVVDVWGICDADLLLSVHRALETKTKPFWAFAQTSGNHPPFTVPRHLADFQVEARDSAELAAGGFVSAEEFNAVRLMDFSLKTFFEAASKAPYYRNTVFVIWADHGVPRGNTDPRFGDLNLSTFRIPFLIHAPGFQQEGRVIRTVGNQMDILPTLMSFLGRPYRHQTLGKDLLDPAWETKGAAFTFTLFRVPPRTGLVQEGHYVNLEPDGRAALYRLDEADPKDLSATDPARAARMKTLTEGFLHWSKFLLSHNPPMEPAR